MAGARFLTASRIAGNAETRDSYKPRINYRPAFESILRTGDLSSAPEKLSTAFKSLMAVAAKKGASREVDSVLKTYASEIGNDIVLLTLRRLERLVEGAPKGQLKDRLAMCSVLMQEFHDAADAVPVLLTGSGRITSSGRLGLDSMRAVLRRGIRKSRSLCPKEISTAIKTELESGRLDDIRGVAEVRKEQAGPDRSPVPAIASAPFQTPHINLQETRPQAAGRETHPHPQKTDTPYLEPFQAMPSGIRPAQIWKADIDLLASGKPESPDPAVAAAAQIKEEVAQRPSMEPSLETKPRKPGPGQKTQHAQRAPAQSHALPSKNPSKNQKKPPRARKPPALRPKTQISAVKQAPARPTEDRSVPDNPSARTAPVKAAGKKPERPAPRQKAKPGPAPDSSSSKGPRPTRRPEGKPGLRNPETAKKPGPRKSPARKSLAKQKPKAGKRPAKPVKNRAAKKKPPASARKPAKKISGRKSPRPAIALNASKKKTAKKKPLKTASAKPGIRQRRSERKKPDTPAKKSRIRTSPAYAPRKDRPHKKQGLPTGASGPRGKRRRRHNRF